MLDKRGNVFKKYALDGKVVHVTDEACQFHGLVSSPDADCSNVVGLLQTKRF
jgi:hypothetical protein